MAWGLAVLLGALVGCTNLSLFQTPEVVEEDAVSAGGGVTVTKHYGRHFDLHERNPEWIIAPNVNIWYRKGVREGLEIQTMFWLPLGLQGGAKYQLVGEAGVPGAQMAIGANVGYINMRDNKDDNAETLHMTDIYIPLHTGYRFSDSFAGYVTPRYILRILAGERSDRWHTIAASVGVALGKDTQVHLEFTPGFDITHRLTLFTGGFGVNF